jgi:hypothetical protein
VELNYGVADGWDLRITTRGLDVGDLHAWRFGDVPLLDRVSEGSWRGWMRYRKPAAAEAAWSGEYELQNARVAIDGLADPVRIRNAAVTANPRGVSVSRLRAAAGEIEFTGDYQWDAHETTPHHFQIQAASLDVQELARLWTPTLARGDGFLARTLRFGAPPPVPDWLTERQAEGTLMIQALTAGDYTLKTETVRVVWDGPSLKISGIEAGLGDAAISGDLSIDLSGGTAGYRFEGTLEDFAYKGGALDFTGKIESAGAGVELLANLRAEGFLRGRSIVFSPEAEFRNVAGRFEMSVVRGVPRWTLSDLELVQAGETYSGEGKTQADGRLVLELASRGRQVRYTGTLAALAPEH